MAASKLCCFRRARSDAARLLGFGAWCHAVPIRANDIGHAINHREMPDLVHLEFSLHQSVMGFLMQHGVEKDRLTALGKGATELLLPDQPEATANRRVRITTLN